MALCVAYTCVYVTRNDTRPPSTQGRHKHRGTHPRTHIQGPGKCETMGDGGIQPRGTWTSVGVVVRRGRSLLGRLAVTDALKDNPRVVSLHMRVESTPNHTRRQAISPSQGRGLRRQVHRPVTHLWGTHTEGQEALTRAQVGLKGSLGYTSSQNEVLIHRRLRYNLPR